MTSTASKKMRPHCWHSFATLVSEWISCHLHQQRISQFWLERKLDRPLEVLFSFPKVAAVAYPNLTLPCSVIPLYLVLSQSTLIWQICHPFVYKKMRVDILMIELTNQELEKRHKILTPP